MQKLLSLMLGAAISMNMAGIQSAVAQAPSLAGLGKMKPLKAAIQLDHRLSTVNGNQGALTAIPIGGIAPYSYKWSTGSLLYYVNGLTAGTYTVTVTDATGARFVATSQLGELDCETASCEFRTQTMGGWGAPPNGNNNGVYLHANFAAAFPGGLVVGCNSNFTLTLTSAQAITDFLPSGSTAMALAADYVDPAGALDNVLAGQVVALSLSVGFDNYDASFGTSTAALADLVIASGDFAGMTVQQVLDEANAFLGGCPSAYSASQLNDAVSSINENFVGGNRNNGYLLCPEAGEIEVTINATDVSCSELCDGTAEAIVSGGNAPYEYLWSNSETTASISGLCPANYDLLVIDALGCEGVANADVNPAEPIVLEGSSQDETCPGYADGSASVIASGGNPPYSYSWSPSGGSAASASNLSQGLYTVTVEDANGCSAAIQVEINLENQYCYSRFGLNESITTGVAVYPSMISTEVKIISSLEESANATVIITSLEGKVAISNTVLLQSNKEVSINTSDLAPGIYSMSVALDTQNFVYRLVKN